MLWIDCIACIIIQATVKIGSIYLEKSDVVLFINVSEGYEKKRQKPISEGKKGEPNDIQKIVVTYQIRKEELCSSLRISAVNPAFEFIVWGRFFSWTGGGLETTSFKWEAFFWRFWEGADFLPRRLLGLEWEGFDMILIPLISKIRCAMKLYQMYNK